MIGDIGDEAIESDSCVVTITVSLMGSDMSETKIGLGIDPSIMDKPHSRAKTA